jgi:UDP-N-acetylmuramyl pentapeptide phosphotransferase/UDP-N-acetylglucosamine-1-phosphate transferase
MEIITIPVITAIVYAIIEIIKTANPGEENLKRFIPLIAGGLGIVCAVIAYFFIPGVLPTDNAVIAALMGGASGLASTGLYENIKNIFVKGGEIANE